MKEKKVKRLQTAGEEVANAISHGLMAIFGIVALVLLLLKSTSVLAVTASLFFGISMIALYLSSTLYHALAFTKSKGIFKRFDHLSIYMLIGGSFAPALLLLPEIHLFGLENYVNVGFTLFIGQWLLILTGMIMKSIWVYKFQIVHIAIFLLIGWSAIIFIKDLYLFSSTAMWLILAGGLSYSIGVIFYSKSDLKYFHFIWHIFVALGTILQFIAIYGYLIG